MAAGGAKSNRPGEVALIETYFAPLAAGQGAFALKDDAASLRVPAGRELVITADMLVADVHFLAADPPSAIAKKALRVNLSDLAAKGAEPAGYILALALNEGWTEDWLRGFTLGLKDDQHTYAIGLLGGDTVSTPGPTTISITALGTVPAGRMVARQTARPGDVILVTGTIGDAALGLLVHGRKGHSAVARIGEAERAYLAERYLFPQPRLGLGALLRRHASAAMDISDGLIGDLEKMCRASRTAATIAAASVPLSNPARALLNADPQLMEKILTGGDDYELLICAPAARAGRLAAQAADAGIAMTAIGTMGPATHANGEGPVAVRGADGERVAFGSGAYEHF